MSIAEQLEAIGQPFADNVVGGITLGGLPEQFRPSILGIQGSKQTTTVEFVKSLLLQDNVKDMGAKPVSAFATSKPQSKRVGRGPRCYECNQYGHIRAHCPRNKHSKQSVPRSVPKSASTSFAALSLASVTTSSVANEWFLDSGATSHLTAKREWINDFVSKPDDEVGIANGTKLASTGSGVVSIPLASGYTMDAHDVVHVPDLKLNLLSVSKIVGQGNRTMIFDVNGCQLVNKQIQVNPRSVLATGTQTNGMYCLNRNQSCLCSAELEKPATTNLWHRRFGHLSHSSMKQLQNMATGVKRDKSFVPCEACVKGKQARVPFKKSGIKRSRCVLGLIHSDVCGPMNVPSVGGARYFLTFTDDCTRHSAVYFLRSKSEVPEKFAEYKALVENQTSQKIKVLSSDNGTEYVNEHLSSMLHRYGIKHETTVPYSKQHNGVAERLNRTLVERARTMLIESHSSPDLWAEAIATAVYLKNRSPTKALSDITPQEAWSGHKPDLRHLRIFGCRAFAKIPDSRRKKWDAKSQELIFVGYCKESKGYRLVHPVTEKLTRSRDVSFFEHEFLASGASAADPFPVNPDVNGVSQFSSDDSLHHSNLQQTSVEVGESKLTSGDSRDPVLQTTVEASDETDNQSAVDDDMSATSSDNSEIIEDRPKRVHIPNKRIFNDDYVVGQAQLHTSDPTTVEEALNSPNAADWKRAMEEEIQAHAENSTWTLSDLPSGRKAIKCKWVFKTKFDANGHIERRKARLVAKGCA